MDIIWTVALIVAGYVLGSVPFSYIVAKANGVDLRTVGSGNIGGANVWRSCGFGPFVLAASGDVLKGTLPTLAAIHIANLAPIAVVLVGMAAILGHTFPVFLNFKGGKAVATGGGVLLALFPLLTLIGLVAWVIGFSLTRISSVGSLTAAAVVAVGGAAFLLLGNLPLAYAVFVWATCGFVLYLHRGNIQRLRAGTENRFQKLR